MRLLIASILFASLAGNAQALEVWLASTQSCNGCAIYDRVAQQRGYGNALRYADRGGMRIPILTIDKGVLAADVVSQLPDNLGPKSAGWDVTLLVLVMDVDRVVVAGNIADSADNNELRRSHAAMFPPASPTADDPALDQSNFYGEFFATHWNLEYFVDVALGKQPKRVLAKPIELASPAPATLGARNVILWGSAGLPAANALFIPTRMNEIRGTLEAAKLPDIHYVTLFGHGPGVEGNDTSYVEGGRTLFKHADVRADFAADAAGLSSTLTGVMRADRARTLLVQVGRSGPTGAPLWGHGLTLTAADLEPIKREAAGKMIMVSGACMGGQFAKAVQCGFFAAHPEVTATGCQLSPQALATSDDYLRHFFSAATGAVPTTAAPGGKRARPVPATLYDAHWYASTRLEDHELSYTTTDALIDDYFAAHPDRLPASLTVAEIRLAAPKLVRAEADAVAALTQGLAPDLAVPLTGYLDVNRAADAKLAEARELSSAERNAILALPYKLELVLLARRIAYSALDLKDADFTAAATCERESLQQFFGTGRAR